MYQQHIKNAKAGFQAAEQMGGFQCFGDVA